MLTELQQLAFPLQTSWARLPSYVRKNICACLSPPANRGHWSVNASSQGVNHPLLSCPTNHHQLTIHCPALLLTACFLSWVLHCCLLPNTVPLNLKAPVLANTYGNENAKSCSYSREQRLQMPKKGCPNREHTLADDPKGL